MPTFDPVVYWKLKANIASLMLQEVQVRAQLQTIETAKLAQLTGAGLAPGNYTFDDDLFEVRVIEPPAPAAPTTATPEPAAPASTAVLG